MRPGGVTGPLVADVSDTARWVAVYRAWESARPDALFHDRFADRFAGDRGRAIAAALPGPTRQGWAVIIRTKLIDDLVLASIAEGCDCVLDLGAGLCTRPYRLALPPSLLWIEADLPAMIEEKERLLADETPVCRLSREKVDLADARQRSALLERVAGRGTRVLVISEGLLPYLDEGVVRSLGRDLAFLSAIRFWILDVVSPKILRMLSKAMGKQLDNAPLKFAPANGIAFFESLGWTPREVRSIFHEAVRLRRVPLVLRPFALLPQPDPRTPGGATFSPLVRFERDGAQPLTT